MSPRIDGGRGRTIPASPPPPAVETAARGTPREAAPDRASTGTAPDTFEVAVRARGDTNALRLRTATETTPASIRAWQLQRELDEVVLAQATTGSDPRQAELDRILRENQVRDDTMVRYTPNLGPYPIDIPFVGSRTMTQTEASLLDELGRRRGLLGLEQFRRITSNDPNDPGLAYRTADQFFPQVDAAGNYVPGGEDGHNDAFRHAYWNALMTDRFGESFANAFGTAHEGVPGNPADREAMDLHNNALGRRIATENPGASDAELAELVYQAIQNGEAVVIDGQGELAFSDQVAVGATGLADDAPVDGTLTPPEYTGSS